jgi:hypothetical protein
MSYVQTRMRLFSAGETVVFLALIPCSPQEHGVPPFTLMGLAGHVFLGDAVNPKLWLQNPWISHPPQPRGPSG